MLADVEYAIFYRTVHSTVLVMTADATRCLLQEGYFSSFSNR